MPPSPFAPTVTALARVTCASPASAAARAAAVARLRSFRRIVRSRESARRFEPGVAVPDGVWLDVLEMTRTSPSGFNLQPTHVILVRSPRLKSRLSEHVMLGFGNQRRTSDASGVAVFCADLQPARRVDRVFDMERHAGVREDGYLAVLRVASSFLTGEASTAPLLGGSVGGDGGSSTYVSTFFKRVFADSLSPAQPMPTMEDVGCWSYKNAGIVAQTYTLAATAHGLSTCMMEGFDARRAKEILRVPDRYGVPLMVATGYEHGAPAMVHANPDEGDDEHPEGGDGSIAMQPQRGRTPRLEMDELFFGETFGGPLDFLQHDVTSTEKETVA